MSTATWVRSELEQGGVTFEEVHHPEAYTAQTLAQREHFSGHRVAKVVVAMVDGRPVELILPASRRVRLDRVQRLLGAGEVRLATEAEMEQHFGDCETGAIPPLRHWQNVEVLLHLRLGRQPHLPGAEEALHPVEADAPAGRQDQLDRPAIDHRDDDLRDAVAAEVLALRQRLRRERLVVVRLLEGDARLLQLTSDPGCRGHDSPPK